MSGIDELLWCYLLPWKRRPRSKRRRKDLSGTRAPRDTGVSLSFPLAYMYDLAHFVPHSGHTYAVASRTSSKFTAREHAAGTDARLRPCHAESKPLLSCIVVARTSSVLRNHPSLLSRQKRDRNTDGIGIKEDETTSTRVYVDGVRGNDMYHSCTQFIPTAGRNKWSPPRIYSSLLIIFRLNAAFVESRKYKIDFFTIKIQLDGWGKSFGSCK